MDGSTHQRQLSPTSTALSQNTSDISWTIATTV